jgi:hypothetical protein
MHVRVESVIEETPRVLQVRGLFDLPPEKTSAVGNRSRGFWGWTG